MHRANVLIAKKRTLDDVRFASPHLKVERVSQMRFLEQALVTTKPAVAVVALDLPGLGGAAGLRAVRALSPSTKVVALSRRADDSEELAVLRMGAKGYVASTSAAMLLKVIEKVQQGEIWAARKTIGALFDELMSSVAVGVVPDAEREIVGLTRRESQILALLGDGASNKEIATALDVSVSTVKSHLTNVFRKLGQPDRLRLALALARASRHGG